MAHEIAKLMLEHAGTFLERTEAIRVSLSLGIDPLTKSRSISTGSMPRGARRTIPQANSWSTKTERRIAIPGNGWALS